jgi:acetolactate synthase small subunit
MNEQTFNIEIHDQPDVLVRIIQIIHRRGGHIRSLQIETEAPWSKAHVIARGISNPSQIAKSLEKLIDVRRVHVITSSSHKKG